MKFKIKLILAWIFRVLGISEFMLYGLGKKYNYQYIRIVNYHATTEENRKSFERQIRWYRRHFNNIDYLQFERFLKCGRLSGEKPGIMLTFDDGYENNYSVAMSVLDKYKMTGYFLVSPSLIGTSEYMTYEQLNELILHGHVIGDHTNTHHRMNKEDSKETLEYEIATSKSILEKNLKKNIDIFCWCGGEEVHYTKEAFELIKLTGYKYGFMTNSYPVLKGNDPYKIQRINVEDSWSIALTSFQVSGFMDLKFRKKRKRVNSLMDEDHLSR